MKKWFQDLTVRSRAMAVRDKSLVSDKLFAKLSRHKRRESADDDDKTAADGGSGGSGGGLATSVLGLLHGSYRRPRNAAADSDSDAARGVRRGGEASVDKQRVMRNMKLFRDRHDRQAAASGETTPAVANDDDDARASPTGQSARLHRQRRGVRLPPGHHTDADDDDDGTGPATGVSTRTQRGGGSCLLYTSPSPRDRG